ncbi:hypothetical protein M885DRAFT_518796 [Pelagophyceae sp. CCMP2097]|nr:hypothetical protein M885DRAFT_518796 [Pelagophyceae sp. CCMP2097]
MRYPYSFSSDDRTPAQRLSTSTLPGVGTQEGSEPTWHDAILAFDCHNNVRSCAANEAQMLQLGRKAGVELDYGVKANWQPVESQRAMLWARRFGAAEVFMDELGTRHFEQQKSASHRGTLLESASAAGLDAAALDVFLDTDELDAYVWESYGSTIRDKGIHAIPLFVFGPRGMKSPFRAGTEKAVTVNGSGDAHQFLDVFERLLQSAPPQTAP